MVESAPRTLRGKTAVRRLHRATRDARGGRELVFVLQDWTDPYNVGGLYRVADAVGALEVVATGRTPLDAPPVAVTSLGAHRRIPTRHIERHVEAVETLRAEGYAVVAVEIADGAVDFHTFEFPERVALVLGHETKGVYESVLRACDAAVYIPMAGKGRSLNVHVAAAVAAFEVFRER